jgi:broad specificity phosphatase PhoE
VATVDAIARRFPGERVLVIAHGMVNRVIVGFARRESVRSAIRQRPQPGTRLYLLAWPPAGPGAVDSVGN